MGLFGNFFGGEKEKEEAINYEDNPFLSSNNNTEFDNKEEFSEIDNNKIESHNENDIPVIEDKVENDNESNIPVIEENIDNQEQDSEEVVDSQKLDSDETISNNVDTDDNEIQKIEFRIENEKEILIFTIESQFFGATLRCIKDNNKKRCAEISYKLYNDFISKIKKVINNWCLEYTGDKDNNKWYLDIGLIDNTITIKGNGDYPKNWNELIELISEYELLYKEKTAIK